MSSSTDVTWRARAVANLLAARQRSGHHRLGTKKSRTGCITCKTRRIKCDEVQPECRRCQASGKCCVWSSAISEPQRLDDSPIERQLSDPLRLNQSEKRAYEYFVSSAAPRLGGILDQEFWCAYVLQLSRVEPLVLNSVLAIATLYMHPHYMASLKTRRSDRISPDSKVALKAALNGSLPAIPDEEFIAPDEHHAKALKLFNRAIRAFQCRVEQGKATPLLALVSCVLFICIETIRDNIHSTLTLVAKGMLLMSQLEPTAVDAGVQDLLSLLRQIFERFSIVALTFGHKPLKGELFHFGQQQEAFVFTNLADARSKLFSMMAQSNVLTREASRWKESHIIRATIDTNRSLPETGVSQVEDPVAMEEMDRKARHQLHQWYAAFERLDTAYRETSVPTSHLMMYYYTYSIWLSTRLELHQTAFDKFTQQFREILYNAEVYTKAKAQDQPIFSFEIGAIPPLYFIATKCRIASLRRRALELMRCTPTQESIWGANSTADVCSRLIEFEEEGLDLPHPDAVRLCNHFSVKDSSVPLEERRIHTIELLQHPITTAFHIKATRYLPCGGWLQEVVEELPLRENER